MSFKQFVVENDYEQETKQLKEAAELVVRDCKPLLQDLNINQKEEIGAHLLYRGINNQHLFVNKKVRKDRKPTDTPRPIHDIIDQWFEQNTGIKARSNGLFATNEQERPYFYGTKYFIFPKGQYRLLSSPKVHDLFNYIAQTFRNKGILKFSESMRNLVDHNGQISDSHKEIIYGILNEADYRFLDMEAVSKRSFGEVIVITDSYYALSAQTPLILQDYFFTKIKQLYTS